VSVAAAALITVEHLSIGYANKAGEVLEVVRDVSLELAPRQTLGLVGESGCGKSTLALALLGYIRSGGRRKAGKVCLAGQDLFELPPAALQAIRGGRIALVPQNAGQSLTPTMTIGAQVI
jgi:peptide/nickel transport system ATP-binding protein